MPKAISMNAYLSEVLSDATPQQDDDDLLSLDLLSLGDSPRKAHLSKQQIDMTQLFSEHERNLQKSDYDSDDASGAYPKSNNPTLTPVRQHLVDTQLVTATATQFNEQIKITEYTRASTCALVSQRQKLSKDRLAMAARIKNVRNEHEEDSESSAGTNYAGTNYEDETTASSTASPTTASPPASPPTMDASRIHSACRVIPSSSSSRPVMSLNTSTNVLKVHSPRTSLPPSARLFSFHTALPATATQADVHSSLGIPMVDNLLANKASCTVFSFGEPASAASNTVFGPMASDDADTLGLVPRVAIHLLANVEDIDSTAIDVTFVYVQNDKVVDLLNPAETKLKVREHPDLGVYVDGLQSYPMVEPRDVQYYLESGLSTRDRLAGSGPLGFTVFTIKFGKGGARIQIVDMGEAGGANSKTYSAVSNVLRTKNGFRNNVLTWILKDAMLARHAECVVLANVEDGEADYGRASAALQFAARIGGLGDETVEEDENEETDANRLKAMLADPRQRRAKKHGQNKEQSEQSGPSEPSSPADNAVVARAEQPFSPESPTAAFQAEQQLLKSALDEVDSLRLALKQQAAEHQESMVRARKQQQELEVHLDGKEQDLKAALTSIEVSKSKFEMASLDNGAVEDELNQCKVGMSAVEAEVQAAQVTIHALTTVKSRLELDLRIAMEGKQTLATRLTEIVTEMATKSDSVAEIASLKGRAESLEIEKVGLLRALEDLKVVSEGHRSQADGRLKMLSQRQAGLQMQQLQQVNLGSTVANVEAEVRKDGGSEKIDLEIALESERELRLKAEEIAALVAARSRAAIATSEATIEKLGAAVSALKKEEEVRGRQRRGREKEDVGKRQELELELKKLKEFVRVRGERATEWERENGRLEAMVKDKDIALGVLSGEYGSLKQTNDKEIESLWGVVDKLDKLDGEKDGAIKEREQERDQAREELERFVKEGEEMRARLAEAEEHAKTDRERLRVAEQEKMRVEGEKGKLRKELSDIDKQLLSALENEGIDLLDLKEGGESGVGWGGKENFVNLSD